MGGKTVLRRFYKDEVFKVGRERRSGGGKGFEFARVGGLQKLTTFFSGWAGLQKLITDLDRFYPYKGEA